MATVLSPLTASNYQNALLLSGLQNQYGARIAARATAVESGYGTKIAAVDRQAQPWRDLQTRLEKPRSIISGAVGRLRGIRDLVSSLISTVEKAHKAAATGAPTEGHRASFDSQLRSLRARVDQTTDSPNLLGNSGARTLSVPTGPNGAGETVHQSYQGVDYRIIDEDGRVWIPDYTTGHIRRREPAGEGASSASGSLASGVLLDGLDGDRLTITIAPATATPQSLTGAIEREGLALVDAWFYDHLATENGRDRALADLNAARRSLDGEISRYRRILTTIGYADGRAAIRLGDFRAQTGALLIERERALASGRDQLQRQFDLATTALTRNQFALGVYKTMFASSGNRVADRVFGTIIDTRT